MTYSHLIYKISTVRTLTIMIYDIYWHIQQSIFSFINMDFKYTINRCKPTSNHWNCIKWVSATSFDLTYMISIGIKLSMMIWSCILMYLFHFTLYFGYISSFKASAVSVEIVNKSFDPSLIGKYNIFGFDLHDLKKCMALEYNFYPHIGMCRNISILTSLQWF